MHKQTATYKVEKKSVNNKAIFNELHKFLDEGIITGQVLWSNEIHRGAFVDIVGDYMLSLMEDSKIDQWNVISDLRNNTMAGMDKGIYIVEVQYRQRNCLNTTRLIYTITDMIVNNLKGLVDFDLTP